MRSSAYGTGGGLACIKPSCIKKQGDELTAEEVYFTKHMQNHHGGMVLINGYLYGADEGSKAMNQPLWKRLKDDAIYDIGRVRLYVSEHRLIYEAIVNGDGDAAAFYVEQHIMRVRRDIAPK